MRALPVTSKDWAGSLASITPLSQDFRGGFLSPAWPSARTR